MRVLHLFNVFGAATERTWLEGALAQQTQGIEVRFACEQRAPEAPLFTPAPVRLKRIHVRSDGDPERELSAIARDPINRDLCDLMKAPIDLVHGHFGPRILHASPFLVRRTPVVISLYGYDATRLLRDPAWALRYRWAAARGATFVVLSQEMRHRVLACGVPHEAIRMIRLGVRLEDWPFSLAPVGQPPTLLFVGRLTEKKRPDDAIKALAILRGQLGFDARLDLIGVGPMEHELRRLTRTLPIEDSVQFLGECVRSEVAARMRTVAAVVLPSAMAPDGDAEGTPVVLIEAQALGTPCISTRHAGIPEVIARRNDDRLVDERNVESLARTMLHCLTEPEAEKRSRLEAGRQWVEQHFNFDDMVKQYVDLYRELLLSRNGCRRRSVHPQRDVSHLHPSHGPCR